MENDLVKCIKCENLIQESCTICPHCNAFQIKQLECPNCKTILNEDEHICRKCSYNFSTKLFEKTENEKLKYRKEHNIDADSSIYKKIFLSIFSLTSLITVFVLLLFFPIVSINVVRTNGSEIKIDYSLVDLIKYEHKFIYEFSDTEKNLELNEVEATIFFTESFVDNDTAAQVYKEIGIYSLTLIYGSNSNDVACIMDSMQFLVFLLGYCITIIFTMVGIILAFINICTSKVKIHKLNTYFKVIFLFYVLTFLIIKMANTSFTGLFPISVSSFNTYGWIVLILLILNIILLTICGLKIYNNNFSVVNISKFVLKMYLFCMLIILGTNVIQLRMSKTDNLTNETIVNNYALNLFNAPFGLMNVDSSYQSQYNEDMEIIKNMLIYDGVPEESITEEMIANKFIEILVKNKINDFEEKNKYYEQYNLNDQSKQYLTDDLFKLNNLILLKNFMIIDESKTFFYTGLIFILYFSLLFFVGAYLLDIVSPFSIFNIDFNHYKRTKNYFSNLIFSIFLIILIIISVFVINLIMSKNQYLVNNYLYQFKIVLSPGLIVCFVGGILYEFISIMSCILQKKNINI